MICTGDHCTGSTAIDLPVTGDFITYGLSLKCLRDKGVDMTKVVTPFVLNLTGPTDITIGEVRLGSNPEKRLTCK